MNPLDALAPYWNFLLVHPILSLLVGAYGIFRDFGLAIVAVTVAIRLILLYPFVLQIRNQRVMQELAPAMNELKKKYPNDRQRQTQEQMKLYQERGYNPLVAGCLPFLLQAPLLFAMYSAFVQAPNLTGEALRGILIPFVPVPIGPQELLDLTAHWLPWMLPCPPAAAGQSCGLGAPDPWHILPILAGATQMVSSLMFQPSVQPKNMDQQQRMMQSMTYYFPLLTIFIAWGLPAGLAIYWVTTTLVGIVQQYFVNGWGQLPRFVPLLRRIPSPADRRIAAGQRTALAEERADMARADTAGPGAQNRRDRSRRNKRKR